MKSLLATTLAAVLALTTTAAPVQAGDREQEIAKIIFGLAAVGIIAHALNDKDSGRGNGSVTVGAGNQGGNHGNQGGIGIPPRHRVLPAACFTRVDTRNGPVRMFGRRCLQNNYRFADRLPERCEITVRGQNHLRRGYRPQCLRNAGFTMARR